MGRCKPMFFTIISQPVVSNPVGGGGLSTLSQGFTYQIFTQKCITVAKLHL